MVVDILEEDAEALNASSAASGVGTERLSAMCGIANWNSVHARHSQMVHEVGNITAAILDEIHGY